MKITEQGDMLNTEYNKCNIYILHTSNIFATITITESVIYKSYFSQPLIKLKLIP